MGCGNTAFSFCSAETTITIMEVNNMKKESTLETQLKILLGFMKRNGATEEEIKNVVNTVFLVRKYLPFYKKKES